MRAVLVASLMPNVMGTLVVAAYVTELVHKTLTPRQFSAYLAALGFFAAVIFPVAAVAVLYTVRRAARSVERLRDDDATGADAVKARRRLLEVPQTVSAISFAIWVLSMPYFPAVIGMLAEPVPRGVTMHMSLFTLLCAVIGAAYTGIFPLHVALRLLLPWTTLDARDLGAQLGLGTVPRRLRMLQLLSAACLPTSAVIALAFWPDPMGTPVRLMLGVLLWVGTLGAVAAMYSAAEAISCAEAVERLRARIAK
jgi:hypothetical protein